MTHPDQQHLPGAAPGKDLISDYVDDLQAIDREYRLAGVKRARNALFLCSGLVFAGEMLTMFMNDSPFSLLIFAGAFVEAGIFLALGFLTRSKPYQAIVGGIVAFIGMMALGMVLGWFLGGAGEAIISLLRGFIFKIFMLVTLFKALRDARSLRDAGEPV